MSKNKYRTLLDNSLIFAIGNIGSKLMTILLVPLYTYFLTPAEYGLVDIISTTILLLLPVVTASIFESVLRFSLDPAEDKIEIFTNSSVVSFVLCAIFILIGGVVIITLSPNGNWFFLIPLIVIQAFHSLLAQFSRAINKLKLYAVNSIVLSVVLVVSNCIFLVIMNLGVTGYFISQIVSYIVATILFVWNISILDFINKEKVSYSKIKELLLFSMPLIPTQISWWLVNSSSRYFIAWFVNASANGLYAVAGKIPGVLNIFTGMFIQAWQISVIEEKDSEEKEHFFSQVFSLFSSLLTIVGLILLSVIKPTISLMVQDSFYESWKQIPFLLLGVIFSSISAFLGQIYVMEKRTNAMFKTSIIPAVVSIVMNILLIPFLGLYGASISQSVCWLFAVWYRIIDTRKFFEFKLDIFRSLLNILLYLVASVVLYMFNNTISFILILILAVILIVFNYKDLKKITSLKK